MSQTEDYSLEDSFPDYSEKLLQGSTVFNMVLYLVKTKNIKQAMDIFLQGFYKKQTSTYQGVSVVLAPGKGVLSLKEIQCGYSKEGGI